MREKGQLVKRGSLSEEGDVEFWDDGTTTERSANFIPHEPDEDTRQDRLREQPSVQKDSDVESGSEASKKI